jgi:hypothetical protein
MSDPDTWWTGCGIQVGDPDPFIWCGQGDQNQFLTMSDSFPAVYDRWYTLRVELDTTNGSFTSYIDRARFYSRHPADGVGRMDNNTTLDGYTDDVRVGN